MTAIAQNSLLRLPPWEPPPFDVDGICVPAPASWKGSPLTYPESFRWPILCRAETEAHLFGFTSIADYQESLVPLGAFLFPPRGPFSPVRVPKSAVMPTELFRSDVVDLASRYPAVMITGFNLGPGCLIPASGIAPVTDSYTGVTEIPNPDYPSSSPFPFIWVPIALTTTRGGATPGDPQQWLGGDCLQIWLQNGGQFAIQPVTAVDPATELQTVTAQLLPNLRDNMIAQQALVASAFRRYRLVLLYLPATPIFPPGATVVGDVNSFDYPIMAAMNAVVYQVADQAVSTILPIVEAEMASFYGGG